MGARTRAAVATAIGAGLVMSGLGAVPASAAGTITCSVTPGNPVQAVADTPVSGRVTCTNSSGAAVTLRLVPRQPNVHGPDNGKLSFNAGTGDFRYIPGFYPPDANGVQDPLPEFTGPDAFSVDARSADGARTTFVVPIQINPKPRSCNAGFVPQTQTMFNNPAGSQAAQYRMLRYLIDMIDCVPAVNPDGSQGFIRFSFYSMSYPPVQEALVRATRRGVSVQALTNSHADKYPAWRSLEKALGSDTRAVNFAAPCWQGCITPRSGPVAGGPTSWFSAEPTSLTGRKVIFINRSIPGTHPIVRWQWNLGDGTRVEGPGPHTHTYRKDGTYKPSLTVTDAAGRKHSITGDRTLPDNLEPMYPSLHSKLYLFSTVGTGASQRRWVSAYSSGNPTYFQSRKGFNNMNVAVGDKALFDIFNRYFTDMVRGSRGELMTRNYFRTFYSPGNPASGARPTTVHLLPQTKGDINRDILKSIKCRYKVGKKKKRTAIRVSMFVFTRRGVAADLWKLAMRKGCWVEIVYTQMSQRVKGSNGRWLADEDGNTMNWGVADCLSTPRSKVVVVKAKKGRPAKRKRVKNSVYGPDGICSAGTLRGKVPVTSSGMWLNRKGYKGGRLKVRMSCPVKPKYDPVKKTWAVQCIRNDIFTHHKMMLVNGHIKGKRQKYVMTGSANWSSPGLRASDEIITEIERAKPIYKAYKRNYDYQKKVVAKNSKKRKKKKKKTKTYVLQASADTVIDVRGMTDEQLAGQDR